VNTRTSLLVAALKGALGSTDLAQIESVHDIVDKESYQGVEGLFREIEHDPVNWLLVVAPGVEKALVRATRHSRSEWLEVLDAKSR